MNRKMGFWVIGWVLSSGFALAESVHLPQAIEHTKTAITLGEASNHNPESVYNHSWPSGTGISAKFFNTQL